MKKNFRVGQSNELICGSDLFEIPNYYILSHLIVTADRGLEILFVPDSAYKLGRSTVRLTFEGVLFLEISDGFGTRNCMDVSEFGYKSEGDFDLDWLVGEARSTTDDHFFVRLGGDDFVRVLAEKAVLTTQCP